jgi:hypothetical protein
MNLKAPADAVLASGRRRTGRTVDNSPRTGPSA